MLLPLVLLLAAPVAAPMPSGVTAALNRAYPGWQMAAVAPQVTAWFDEYHLAYRPNRIAADFDGDGKTDYAVRIQWKGKALTLALLDRGGNFESELLSNDPPDPFTYFLLYKRGDKDFDFTTLKPFRHAHDAIGLMYFDKTPLTFRWAGGKFQRMLSPSDEEAGNGQ